MSMRDELHVCFTKEMGRRNAVGTGTQITEINSSQHRLASLLEGVDSNERKSPSPFGKSNSIRCVKSPKMSEKKELNICRTQDNSLIGGSGFTITAQPVRIGQYHNFKVQACWTCQMKKITNNKNFITRHLSQWWSPSPSNILRRRLPKVATCKIYRAKTCTVATKSWAFSKTNSRSNTRLEIQMTLNTETSLIFNQSHPPNLSQSLT